MSHQKNSSMNIRAIILLLLIFISLIVYVFQVNANERLDDPSSSTDIIVPTIEQLGGDPAILSMQYYPKDLEKVLSVDGFDQHSLSPNVVLSTNVTATIPFAPTGHFENTLVPNYYDLTISVDENLYLNGKLASPSSASSVARSVNQGLTWLTTENQAVKTFSVSPISDSHILMGSQYGIQISYDSGLTWKESETNTGSVHQVLFSPTYAIDKEIFATPDYINNSLGNLFHSKDGGETWKGISLPKVPTHIAVAPDYNASKTILAATYSYGIYYSYDGGTSWNTGNSGLDIDKGNKMLEVIFSPTYAIDSAIFVRTSFGLYRSLNKGYSWTRYLPYDISDFELDPSYAANQTFFMVARVEANGQQFNVLFRTQNNGAYFEGLLANVRDFEMSPNYLTNRNIYAQTDDGLVLSRDNGKSWYLLSHIAPSSSVTQVVPSPNFSNDRTIFLVRRGTEHGNTHYTISKSINLGFTWEKLSIPRADITSPKLIALSPNYGTDQTIILLAAGQTRGTAALYKSVNGGKAWELLKDNLPIDAFRDPNLKLSPNFANDKTIFISGYLEGFYRSRNEGKTWEQLIGDSAAISNIAIAPQYPTDPRLFVSLYNDGISRSNNDGASWEPSNKPGGLALMIDLSPDFSQDNTLFASNGGTSGGGVWRSSDAGDSWTNVSGNGLNYYLGASTISTKFVQDQTLAVQVNNKYVYLSEDKGNTWFALVGKFPNDGQLAISYWQDRPYIVFANNDGFHIYVWPTDVNASFNCPQNLILSSSELQQASIAIGIDSILAPQWRINSTGNNWYSIPQLEGSLPNVPQIIIDSSSVPTAVQENIEVEVFLSYRQAVSLDVPVFLPCYATHLPIIEN